MLSFRRLELPVPRAILPAPCRCLRLSLQFVFDHIPNVRIGLVPRKTSSVDKHGRCAAYAKLRTFIDILLHSTLLYTAIKASVEFGGIQLQIDGALLQVFHGEMR